MRRCTSSPLSVRADSLRSGRPGGVLRGCGVTVQVTTTAYGRPALEALRAAVALVKHDDPMAPVTVLVPNNVAGLIAQPACLEMPGADTPDVVRHQHRHGSHRIVVLD